MSDIEDLQIEQLKCPIYPIVIFGGRIDDYDDGKEHKFVKLYLAKMIKE